MKRNFSILILVCACAALLASSCNRKKTSKESFPRALRGKTCGRQDIGNGYLEHYGFLWLNQRFSHWTSAFDHNRIWLYTDIERY